MPTLRNLIPFYGTREYCVFFVAEIKIIADLWLCFFCKLNSLIRTKAQLYRIYPMSLLRCCERKTALLQIPVEFFTFNSLKITFNLTPYHFGHTIPEIIVLNSMDYINQLTELMSFVSFRFHTSSYLEFQGKSICCFDVTTDH